MKIFWTVEKHVKKKNLCPYPISFYICFQVICNLHKSYNQVDILPGYE